MNLFFRTAVGLVATLAAGALQAGEIVTVPAGIAPGQGYQLAFVTDGVIDASSVSISDYDAFVTAEAMAVPRLAALNTEWRAVVSTGDVSARMHTDTGESFPDDWLYQLDGSLLYTSFGQGFGYVDDFATGLVITPTGATAAGLAWTGTDGGGNASVPLGSANPTTGNIGDTTILRLDNGGTAPNTTRYRIYAVSGVLRVPEPTGGVLSFLVIGGVATWRGVRPTGTAC